MACPFFWFITQLNATATAKLVAVQLLFTSTVQLPYYPPTSFFLTICCSTTVANIRSSCALLHNSAQCVCSIRTCVSSSELNDQKTRNPMQPTHKQRLETHSFPFLLFSSTLVLHLFFFLSGYSLPSS
jgi:hypothetical protein